MGEPLQHRDEPRTERNAVDDGPLKLEIAPLRAELATVAKPSGHG
jgi:hypothetical protein